MPPLGQLYVTLLLRPSLFPGFPFTGIHLLIGLNCPTCWRTVDFAEFYFHLFYRASLLLELEAACKWFRAFTALPSKHIALSVGRDLAVQFQLP
jgi:hypothetical protein